MAIDPLTQLLARESVLERLQEKVDNSKRNKMPFSLLYLSLTDFKNKHHLAEYEMDTTLFKVVETLKQDIRTGLDIAARVGEEDFVLALPGISRERAEIIAERIKRNIFVNVTTPRKDAVDIAVGFVEYTDHTDVIAEEVEMGMGEVEALLSIAIGKCLESTMS
ncbi:MAG: GGDEF domain-containing protein [Methylococcales bacterium]